MKPEVIYRCPRCGADLDEAPWCLECQVRLTEVVKLERCNDCRGNGYIDCPDCHNSGYSDCPKCDGQGVVGCYFCRSEGYHVV
jgi:hypothetical protein